MDTMASHLRLCSKEVRQILPGMYAVLTNDNELTVCCGDTYIDIPLSRIFIVDDHTFALVIRNSNLMGIYSNGELVKTCPSDNTSSRSIMSPLLEYLILNSVNNEKHLAITISVCERTWNGLHMRESITFSPVTIRSRGKIFTAYKSKSNFYYSGLSFDNYLIYDGKLIPYSNGIPKFIFDMGYIIQQTSDSIKVINLNTGRQFVFNTSSYTSLRCDSKYSQFQDDKDRYLLCFSVSHRMSAVPKTPGIVLSLPRDDSDVKMYKGFLSSRNKLIYTFDNKTAQKLTISTLDGNIIAQDTVVSTFNNRYVICYDFIFDIVAGDIKYVRISHLSAATLKSSKSRCTLYCVHCFPDTDHKFYGMNHGELAEDDISLLYSYMKEYHNSTSEFSKVMVAKFRSNGLYVITDLDGMPVYPILFNSEEQAVDYIKSETHETFRHVTFKEN